MLFGALGASVDRAELAARRCCCWPIATGSLTGARWRRCGLICAGRSRWICRSIIPAFTRRAWSSSAPGCCCMARNGSCSSARSELATELGLLEGDGRADRRLDADARRRRDPGHGARWSAPAVRKLIDAVAALDPRAARTAAARPGVRLRAPAREAGRRLARQADPRSDAGRGRQRRPARAAAVEHDPRTRGRRGGRRRPPRLLARSSARSSRPTTRQRRGRVTAAGRGRSSPRTTPRCVTAARPTRAASPATSCTSRRRRRRRC